MGLSSLSRGPVVIAIVAMLVSPMMVPVPEEVHERTADQQEVGQEPERVAPVLAENEETGDGERG
jgi:hypothetical protein